LKVVFIVLWAIVSLMAQEHNTVKITKLAQKGERIVKVMCQKEKLPLKSASLDALKASIKASKACAPLSKSKLEAVAAYLQYGSKQSHKGHIHVPQEAKCPVCGMFVAKYPKWAAMMQIDGKSYYFDGVKDMMKYYIFDGDFPYDRTRITAIEVSDYYTLEPVAAQKAFYVVDPDVYGPMGHELVPFASQERAKTFSAEHHGKKIVTFDDITASMVMALDGIVQ